MSYFVYTRSLYFDIHESKYYSKKIFEKLNNKNICDLLFQIIVFKT